MITPEETSEHVTRLLSLIDDTLSPTEVCIVLHCAANLMDTHVEIQGEHLAMIAAINGGDYED